MNHKKIITYSFLAHINNTGLLVTDLLDVFKPLVKRALALMNNENVFKGKSISEIKIAVDGLYSLDIPLTVLDKILKRIASEINTSEKIFFQIHQDKSFQINNYVFSDFDEEFEKKENEILELEDVFKTYCEINGLTEDSYSSIYDFIDKNKMTLASLLSRGSQKNIFSDFTNEAKFIEYIKTYQPYYNIVKNIYLGSIISTYIEYETKTIKSEVELIFDTNFILSLLDLNSPESTQNCKKLVDICKSMGFRLNILDITVTETTQLLEKKAEHFDTTFLAKKIDPEDIFNACDRRNLSKTDLERIANNLEEELLKLGILIVPNTVSYQNKAKQSIEYENLKKYRFSSFAALHDATAIYYVRAKRNNKKTKDFDKAACWFVNNSSNQNSHFNNDNEYLPETLKAEDLLNILWLSNPNIKSSLNYNELTEIGLTRLISCTLNESLPKAAVIRELEDNIQKYAAEEISDRDVVRIATRIANRSLTENIESLNDIAKVDKQKFVSKIQEEAKKEEEAEEKRKEQLNKMLEVLKKIEESNRKETKKRKQSVEEKNQLVTENADLLKKFTELQTKVETIQLDNDTKVRDAEISIENKYRTKLREEYIQKRVSLWKWKPVAFLALLILLELLIVSWYGNWNLYYGYEDLKINENVIFWVVQAKSVLLISYIIKIIFNRWHQESNINAYKTTLEKSLPDDLKII